MATVKFQSPLHLNWVAFDLDGTLADSVYDPSAPNHDIGEPIPEMVALAKRYALAGWTVCISTARGWEHVQAIRQWLRINDLAITISPYNVYPGKLLVSRIIDDRAFNINDPEAFRIPERVVG